MFLWGIIMVMVNIYLCISLTILGLCIGSFAAACVWRLRARQLFDEKKNKEPIDSKEYGKLKRLLGRSFFNDRSCCLECGKELAWYDLLPLISWISTRGKCRYCHKKIGSFEPIMEFGVAVLFLSSYILWPNVMQDIIGVAQFVIWLASGLLFAILFAYDLKWYILPNSIVFPAIGLGAINAFLHIISSHNALETIIGIAASLFILSGIYLILWFISRGKWIGFGDVKLGVALAFLIIDWKYAFVTLFLANLIGCLIVIPGMITKKITQGSRIPFGPLLILGAFISIIFGKYILRWYFSIHF